MEYKTGLASLFSTHARGSDRAPKQTCQHCKKEYTLGVNGTVDGCDDCTGTARAVNGYAIDTCTCLEKEGDSPNCPVHLKS